MRASAVLEPMARRRLKATKLPPPRPGPAFSHVAFANPGGTAAAILTNSGPAKTVSLRMLGMEAKANLPGNSVVTLTWAS